MVYTFGKNKGKYCKIEGNGLSRKPGIQQMPKLHLYLLKFAQGCQKLGCRTFLEKQGIT